MVLWSKPEKIHLISVSGADCRMSCIGNACIPENIIINIVKAVYNHTICFPGITNKQYHVLWVREKCQFMILFVTFFILAGMPTAVENSGTSHNTTALAPILAPFPILIGPSIFAPAPINTSSSITGEPFLLLIGHTVPSRRYMQCY